MNCLCLILSCVRPYGKMILLLQKCDYECFQEHLCFIKGSETYPSFMKVTLYPGVLDLHDLGFVVPGNMGTTGVASLRSCKKLPQRPTEPIPGGSKDRHAN